MARTSLAERQARLEQSRARLQRDEASIREAERKARTRRLIEAGGLVDKAGLAETGANVLYGALLDVAAKIGDADQVARWEASGGRAFDREAKARDADREPLILTLDGTQPALVSARLRGLGFRWSRVLQHWEGLAVFDDAKAAADELGAVLRRVPPAGAGMETDAATGTQTQAAMEAATEAATPRGDPGTRTAPATPSADAAE